MKPDRMLCWTMMVLICVAGRSGERRLTDFAALMAALKGGTEVRVIIHYGACKLISDNRVQERVPDAVGGMTMDTFEYFAPGTIGNKLGFVSCSHTQLIQHPGRGMVYNYAKVRVLSDGTVEITARYLLPGDLSVVMDECFYTTMADGNGNGAAHFFELD